MLCEFKLKKKLRHGATTPHLPATWVSSSLCPQRPAVAGQWALI